MLSLYHTLPVLDRVFDDVMRESFRGFASPEIFRNGLDVRTTNEKLMLEVDLPGVRAEDVSVEIEGNTLRVRAERKARNPETSKRSGTFAWAYELPQGFDTDAMQASLVDGVLTVEIPRHPKAMARKIPILTNAAGPKQLSSAEEPKSA